MSKKKTSKWLLIALGFVLFAAIISILFGEGYLNLGALGVKVKRVAQTACQGAAVKEDKYCVYTLEPRQYWVMPDGKDYVIYGDNISNILTENSIVIEAGRIMAATSYSLMRTTPLTTTQVASSPFSSLNLGFKYTSQDGSKFPSLTLSGATAKKVQGARFIEIELPKLVKIRLNSFYLP